MNIRLIAYAVAFGALLLVGFQWHARGKEIDRLNKVNGEITAQYAQCAAQQKTSDEALTTLRAAGEADRLKREDAERKSAQTVADSERKVRAALTAHVPTECPAAMQWLGDYGRELSNRWEPSR